MIDQVANRARANTVVMRTGGATVLFVLTVLLGCGSRGASSSTPSSVQEQSSNAATTRDEDATYFVVQRRRLLGPTDDVWVLDHQGTLQCFRASRLVVHSVSEFSPTVQQIEQIRQLASSIVEKREVGSGVQEGDLYEMYRSDKKTKSAFLESLAPPDLLALVSTLDQLCSTTTFRAPVSAYLFAEPIEEAREKALLARGTVAVPLAEFGELAGEGLRRALQEPFRFVPISPPIREACASSFEAGEVFVRDPHSAWVQVTLWASR